MVQVAAKRYAEAGLSPIPVFSAMHKDPDKRKKATVKLSKYQNDIASPQEISRLFSNGANLAVACGSVSGNLEVIDFDEPALVDPFMQILRGNDSLLTEKLLRAETPRGGSHLIYRCQEPVDGSKKLAMTEDGKTVLIETRGQGAYFLVAPSEGYELHGDITKVQTLKEDERALLLWIASTFDCRNQVEKPRLVADSGDRPDDIFNRIANWNQLLSEDGWRQDGEANGRTLWTRPGKKGGTSATLNDLGFFVFTTSTPLPTGEPVDPFGYLVKFRFDGDFKAAARWIVDSFPDEFRSSPAIPVNSGYSGYVPATVRLNSGQVPVKFRSSPGQLPRMCSRSLI